MGKQGAAYLCRSTNISLFSANDSLDYFSTRCYVLSISGEMLENALVVILVEGSDKINNVAYKI